MFRYVWIVLLVLAVAAGTGALVAARSGLVSAAPRWVASPAQTSRSPAPPAARSPSPAPAPPLLRPGPVTIDSPGFWSWALLDTRTGEISGSKNLNAPSTTASMIKAWIAADYLRLTANAGKTPSQARLGQLRVMIRDSDNEVAETVFREIGAQKSIVRLISICKLTETKPYRNWWSNTSVSARDTARMAACIGDGRAAGPRWTKWLLEEMRLVRGAGDFGIRKALPPDVAKRTPIKNGWVLRDEDGKWHVACLAVGDGWTLGVLVRYPGSLGFTHGANVCRSVAAQLLRTAA